MTRLTLSGIGYKGPQVTDWEMARSLFQKGEIPLQGETPRGVAFGLPPAERRRATAATRLAIDVAMEALKDQNPTQVTSIFTSSGGEIGITHGIFESLGQNPPGVSPTAFHNSVHNAASGYFGIASHSQQPSDSLCALDDSLGAGLSECLLRFIDGERNLLLVSYDLITPFPMSDYRHITQDLAVAFLLEGDPSLPLGQLDIQYHSKPSSRKGSASLERNPIEVIFPLLRAIALNESTRITLGAGLGGSLEIDYLPWK